MVNTTKPSGTESECNAVSWSISCVVFVKEGNAAGKHRIKNKVLQTAERSCQQEDIARITHCGHMRVPSQCARTIVTKTISPARVLAGHLRSPSLLEKNIYTISVRIYTALAHDNTRKQSFIVGAKSNNVPRYVMDAPTVTDAERFSAIYQAVNPLYPGLKQV